MPAIVMDLYSRGVIGLFISTRMAVDLLKCALQMVINIRQPKACLMFLSDRASQYTSIQVDDLVVYKIIASMCSVGTCLYNTVVERFLVA